MTPQMVISVFCVTYPFLNMGSLMVQLVKNLLTIQETKVQSLGQEKPL